jgi:pimeloyl-ACP methyl ester carboxylesterase
MLQYSGGCDVDASDAQGSLLAFEERGTGVPIVFVHGLTFSQRTWDPIVDRLAGRFRCVTLDLPGHGESGGLPRSKEEVGPQIHALVTHLGIERPVVVGHSLGGIEATMYAARFPVSGVVNVDQTMEVRPFVNMLHQLEPALRGPHFEAAFEPIRQSIGVEKLPEPLRSRTLATQTVRQELVVAYWNDLFRESPESLQLFVNEATRKISAPYLAVFGRRLTDDERASMHARLPTLELEEWPDLGHMVHLMEPDRFADRLASFIDRCSREQSIPNRDMASPMTEP